MLNFTDRARDVVHSYLEQGVGELQALRIVASAGSPVAPSFELTLVGLDEQEPDEQKIDGPGFPVFIQESSASRLEGASVDFIDRVNESGFEVRLEGVTEDGHPGEEAADSRTARGPTGEIADRVRQVLNTQVNPTISAHGGVINLVDVQETEVFVEMAGGCQGCALSRMTLRQGVERMLRQSVPELTAVHDVTDHASGVNPYFQQ